MTHACATLPAVRNLSLSLSHSFHPVDFILFQISSLYVVKLGSFIAFILFEKSFDTSVFLDSEKDDHEEVLGADGVSVSNHSFLPSSLSCVLT
jgi:hypothetical protein